MKPSEGLQLGDITIQMVREATAPFVDPLKFFPALTREQLDENRAWLEPHALDPANGKLILSFHSWLVRTPHHNVLIDTCVGNHKERQRGTDSNSFWRGRPASAPYEPDGSCSKVRISRALLRANGLLLPKRLLRGVARVEIRKEKARFAAIANLNTIELRE